MDMVLDNIPEKIKDVLVALSDGQSLANSCREYGISERTFYQAMRNDPKVEQEYMSAREFRAHSRFEEIDGTIQELKQGLIDPNTARVIIDTRKWQMGKEKAKVYGDKQPEQAPQVTNNMIITSQVLDLLGQDQLEALRVKLGAAQALPQVEEQPDGKNVLEGEYSKTVSD